MSGPPARVIVAIPVRNEATRIGGCLRALAAQRGAAVDRVVLLLNNCNDETELCVRRLMPTLGINLRIARRRAAGAGHARSLALRHAAVGLAEHDLLLTTDADGVVSADWVRNTLAAFQSGADAVCGRAVIDPHEATFIPAALHADDARECRLAALLDELADAIDPDPCDPLPRHVEHSGASIAVTVRAWRRVGGIPPHATGEDRAFIEALRRIDARIRHAPDVFVTVSGRVDGRAAGGMAETIRRRMVCQDEFADPLVEPAADRVRRLRLRAAARAAWKRTDGPAAYLAHALRLPQDVIERALAAPYFGGAWATLERAASGLTARRVRFTDLPAEIESASALLESARQCRNLPLESIAA